MAIVGYARVSSVGQDHTGQVERLKAAGATKIFQEKRSGVDRERDELKKCLDYVREGDTLLVTKLDRLARSAIDLLNIVREMQGKGVAFKALDQSLDMTAPAGKLQLQVLAAVAEFETVIRRERQMEGIARAKAEGRTGGRPKSVTDAIAGDIRARRIAGESFRSIAKSVGFSVATIQNVLKSAPAMGRGDDDGYNDPSARGGAVFSMQATVTDGQG
jgi:DNA invertase Pin-like site-specific DNA recombinase